MTAHQLAAFRFPVSGNDHGSDGALCPQFAQRRRSWPGKLHGPPSVWSGCGATYCDSASPSPIFYTLVSIVFDSHKKCYFCADTIGPYDSKTVFVYKKLTYHLETGRQLCTETVLRLGRGGTCSPDSLVAPQILKLADVLT